MEISLYSTYTTLDHCIPFFFFSYYNTGRFLTTWCSDALWVATFWTDEYEKQLQLFFNN